ncbi:hypothetical protein AAFF_G00157740 [Aldrovandia affinis]|uniref:Uncharacterized protein n=1 Tax=Aldrovandia affinis TaxID=143900 RepID=A0AAD7RNT8_9TELE|nr:hypothetical protein AAFF_G00157740 [Aldrovandia affinis]
MQTMGLIHTLEQCLNRMQTVGLIHTLEQCLNRMQTVGLIHTLEQCLNRMTHPAACSPLPGRAAGPFLSHRKKGPTAVIYSYNKYSSFCRDTVCDSLTSICPALTRPLRALCHQG